LARINFILRRVVQIIPVLFVVSVLIFSMMHLIPGDPARILLGDMAKQEDVERLREQMGLNESLVKQYLIFMKNLVTLDFGKSLVYKVAVKDLLKPRIGVTIALTIFSTVLAVLIGIPLGYLAGMRKDGAADQGIRVTALLAISMPNFWIALLLMMLFGVILHWLPAGGWAQTFPERFRCLILPACTQCLMTSALLMRNMRNSVVDINQLDYVDFARSKGITETRVSTRHILRNGLISTVTLLLMRMAWMLGGSVIIESVYSIPGMGKLLVDSITARDYAVVQLVVFLFSGLVIIMNLITDVLYSLLDPRVSL